MHIGKLVHIIKICCTPSMFLLLVIAAKTLVLGGCMLPISAGAIGTALLFSCYNISLSRNPDEIETLFNATLMGFALMETFIFTSFIICYMVYLT